jgi:hypothetical protein
MPTLTERLDAQLEALAAERQRIHQQAAADVAAVDAQIDALTAARKSLTPEVERSYAQLKAMGLLKEL